MYFRSGALASLVTVTKLQEFFDCGKLDDYGNPASTQEPRFDAQPEKPVLKKPGAPSRIRLNGEGMVKRRRKQ